MGRKPNWRVAALLGVVMAAPASALAEPAQDGAAMEVRYCGVGFLGKDADKKTNYRYLSQSVIKDNASLGKVSPLLLSLTRDANPHLHIVDNASNGNNYALSYIIAGEKYERQPFVYPLTHQTRYNNIFTVMLNTVVFDLQQGQVVGIYPWIFQYNEASDAPLADGEVAKRFGEFFRKPESLAEGDEPPADAMLTAWSKSVGGLSMSFKANTISASPVQFSEDAAKLITDGGSTPDVMSRDLTTRYEAILSQSLRLPVIPSSGGGAGAGDQFVAAIPSCVGQGDVTLRLPEPAYRFAFDVGVLKSGSVMHSVKRGPEGDQGTVDQNEVGYGARIHVQVIQTDESDTVHHGKVMLDNHLRAINAKTYIGKREFADGDQFGKLLVNFMTQTVNNIVDPQEKWFKEHLSAEESKTKPSAVQSAWSKFVKEKLHVNPKEGVHK